TSMAMVARRATSEAYHHAAIGGRQPQSPSQEQGLPQPSNQQQQVPPSLHAPEPEPQAPQLHTLFQVPKGLSFPSPPPLPHVAEPAQPPQLTGGQLGAGPLVKGSGSVSIPQPKVWSACGPAPFGQFAVVGQGLVRPVYSSE